MLPSHEVVLAYENGADLRANANPYKSQAF